MYEVIFAPSVIAYINAREYLTSDDRERLVAGVIAELGADADLYLSRYPHTTMPGRFWYDFGLMTESHVFRHFYFWCDSTGHIYGVTEVLYADQLPDEPDDEFEE